MNKNYLTKFFGAKMSCNQEYMIIHYQKLIPGESLNAKIKKTIQENAAI